MVNYIIRRILLMAPTILGITMVVFFVMALSPGGIGGNLLNEAGEIDSEQGRIIKEYYEGRYRTDLPLASQYLWWLNQVSPVGFEVVEDELGKRSLGGFKLLKTPDLGESFSRGRPVLDLYAEALPVTLTLNLITVPIVYFLAIVVGIYAARHRGKLFDQVSGVTMLGMWALPVIMVGVLMIGFLANKEYLHWFPVSGLSSIEANDMAYLPGWTEQGFERGWLLDRLWHLVLPVICMTYGASAVLMKLMRGAMLENLMSDFVRTARAKGVDEHRVLWGHVFRNSLIPLITVAAGLLPGLLVGSVLIEKIFSLPGMGKLMIEAIFARDREVVMAATLISGLLGLFCILIADLLYALADPRVSYD